MVVLLPILSILGAVAAQPIGQDKSIYHKNAGVLQYVNPMIGTYGTTPNGNGGMIPSVSTPFGMTRWTPQTRENFISQVPYGASDRLMHGFQATHQPAIWMGESGQVILMPGFGDVQPLFQNRGLAFRKTDEHSTPYVYEVLLDATQLMNRDWNATSEAAGYGPDPGGAGAVPSDVQEGSNGRIRKREVKQDILQGNTVDDDDDGGDDDDDAQYPRSIQVGYAKYLFSNPSSDLLFARWLYLQNPTPVTFVSTSRLIQTIPITKSSIPGYSLKFLAKTGPERYTLTPTAEKSMAIIPNDKTTC